MNKKLLYHYKSLSTLEHFSYLNNDMNQEIWLPAIGKLNDPFEAQFFVKGETPKEILANKSIFDKYFFSLQNTNPQLTEEEFKEALEEPDANKMIGQSQLMSDTFKSHSVICLTDDSSNIPMWAHYADNHQGYCVIFEMDLDFIYEKYKALHQKQEQTSQYTPEEFYKMIEKVFYPNSDGSDQEILSFRQLEDDPLKQFIFTKVMYREKHPVISEVELYEMQKKCENEKNKYVSQNSFGVKFKQWQYENEYRLVVNANSAACSDSLMDLRGYPFIKITGIIMGYKIGQNLDKDALDFIKTHELRGHEFKSSDVSGKVKEFIANLAQKYNVEIFLAECSTEKYEITYKRYGESYE